MTTRERAIEILAEQLRADLGKRIDRNFRPWSEAEEEIKDAYRAPVQRAIDAMQKSGLSISDSTQVAVDRDDLETAVDAMQYQSEYFRNKWGYEEVEERLNAILYPKDNATGESSAEVEM